LVDAIIRMERLEEDVLALCAVAGCDGEQIRTTHSNPSQATAPAFLSRPYGEVLTPGAKRVIDHAWGVDAVVFGYAYNGTE